MTDYFTALGRETAALLAKDADARRRVRNFADQALGRHLNGDGRGMARDAALPIAGQVRRGSPRFSADQDPEMPPRGAEEYDDEDNGEGGNGDPNRPIDASECISAVQKMLRVLPPEEHDQLIGALAELIQGAHSEGQRIGNSEVNGLDRGMRSGRRTGRDQAAMDAQFRNQAKATESFFDRFPGARTITLMGTR